MLYRPEAFEPLTDDPWDEDAVRRAIREIVADAESAYDPEALWPADEWDAWTAPLPLTNLYVGAAGVLSALDRLRVRGLAETALDLEAAARAVLAARRRRPDYARGIELPSHADAALFTGETGVLLAVWLLTRDAKLADDLLARVHERVDDETNEVMWGTPGTMLAARTLLDATDDERWADAWRVSADALWRRRDPDGLWTQRLYGGADRGLGPPHGLVGNVLALLGGGDLLPLERRDALIRDARDALARTAVLEDGLANWPPGEGDQLVADDGQIRLQWCFGGAGIVASAAPYLDEELLLAGAELVWRAGPPGREKGPCLCHGTAGNGNAFLKVFERTGDELWLERARRFAVHALGQVARRRAEQGRGRYSLWTGDPGVALYAADCLEARATIPTLDADPYTAAHGT